MHTALVLDCAGAPSLAPPVSRAAPEESFRCSCRGLDALPEAVRPAVSDRRKLRPRLLAPGSTSPAPRRSNVMINVGQGCSCPGAAHA